jgi:hypothetical protein
LAGVGLLVLGQFVLAPHGTALAATLTVNAASGTVNPADPCPTPASAAVYKTIQKAVNCATAGDTINVAAGTYAENVTISKSLTLRGANAGQDARLARGAESIVDGGLAGTVFGVGAANTTIDGFRVQRGQGGGWNAGIGISASNVQILNNIITDNAMGLAATGVVSATIQRNRFDGNNRLVAPAGGNGLYTDVSTNLTVSSNYFLNHTANVAANFAAAGVSAHTGLNFFDNYLANNRIAVNAMGLSGGTLHNNVFTGSTLYALVFNGGSNGAVVKQNLFSSNAIAIRIADAYTIGNNTNLTVSFNRLLDNTLAIEVAGGYTGLLNAENNWWGCSYGPGAGGALCSKTSNGVSASVDANPWLTLRLVAARGSVSQNGGRVAVSADLTINSASQDTAASGFLPNGTPAQFTGTLGTITPSATTTTGKATATFTAGPTLGTANLSTVVDYQSTATTVAVAPNYLYLPLIARSS